MVTNQNKVEHDLTAWRKQEERIIKLFPVAVINSRAFRIEKLERLDLIYHNHARSDNTGERTMLHMLNIERKKMETKLFPGPLSRLVRALTRTAQTKAAHKREARHRSSTEQSLRNILIKTGFGNINRQLLEQKMQQGLGSITLAHSTQFNADKHIEYEMSFAGDQFGRYKFDQYQATLKSGTHPEQNRRQTFFINSGYHTTAVQAFNLLEGRAVEQEYGNALGGRQTAWVKLDFNDKDNAGNFKRREYHSHPELEKTLESLPLREKTDYTAMEKLLQGLRNGERMQVSLTREGKEIIVAIEVNPALKNVNLYTGNGKKVSLPDALGEKKEKAPVVLLNQANEEKQQRRSGIAMNQ